MCRLAKSGAGIPPSGEASGLAERIPVTVLVQTMNEVPGKFVRTLAAVRDKQAASQPA